MKAPQEQQPNASVGKGKESDSVKDEIDKHLDWFFKFVDSIGKMPSERPRCGVCGKVGCRTMHNVK